VSPKCKSFFLKLILDNNNKEKKENKPLKFQPKTNKPLLKNNNTPRPRPTIKKRQTHLAPSLSSNQHLKQKIVLLQI
jgi:hypothetical protein